MDWTNPSETNVKVACLAPKEIISKELLKKVFRICEQLKLLYKFLINEL